MSTQFKYIILIDGNGTQLPVIFHMHLSHKDVADGIRGEASFSGWSKAVAPIKPVSAGFVYLPDFAVNGRSESLDLKSREGDGNILKGAAA